MAPPPAMASQSHLIPTPGSVSPPPVFPAAMQQYQAAPAPGAHGGTLNAVPALVPGGVPRNPGMVPEPGKLPVQAWRPAVALQGPLPAGSFNRIHPETVALGDVLGLHALARQGAWQSTLEKTTAALEGPADVGGNGARPAVNSPHWVCLKAFQAVSLCKLRRYVECGELLSKLGNLDDDRYSTGANGVSAVPHALFVLQTELPQLLREGKEEASTSTSRTDSHYALAERCNVALRTATSQGDVQSIKTWQRRRDSALYSAVNHHLRGGEYLAALSRLDQLARQTPADTPDPVILSLAGRVHLLLGDTEGAEMCFTSASEALERLTVKGTGPNNASMLEFNQRADVDSGVLLISKKEYKSAKVKFEHGARQFGAQTDSQSALIAMTNLAVSSVYVGDLRGSIKVMENGLRTNPTSASQNVSLLKNVKSTYDVAAADPNFAKRVLASYVLKFAPDDLDPNVMTS